MKMDRRHKAEIGSSGPLRAISCSNFFSSFNLFRHSTTTTHPTVSLPSLKNGRHKEKGQDPKGIREFVSAVEFNAITD
jgi:hypothetical protein